MKLVFLLIGFCVLTSQLTAQRTWQTIVSANIVNDVAFYQDEIWIATNAGITVKNILTDENRYLNKDNSYLPSNDIIGIEVVDNEIFIATKYDGVICIQGKKIIKYNNDNTKIDFKDLRSLFVDKEKNIWLGKFEDIIVLKNGIWKDLKIDYDNYHFFGANSFFEFDKKVFCNGAVGVISIDQELKIKNVDLKTIENNIYIANRMMPDKKGNLWVFYSKSIGNDKFEYYFAKFDGNNYSNICKIYPNPSTIDIYFDNNDSLKLSAGYNIYTFSNNQLEKIEIFFDSLHLVKKYFIRQDKYNNFWVSSGEALYKIRGNVAFKQVISQYRHFNNDIHSIAEFQNRTVFTTKMGIYQIIDNYIQKFYKEYEPEGFKIICDKANTIWIGISYGLLNYNGNNWYKYDYTNSLLSGRNVTDFDIYNNKIWLSEAGNFYIPYQILYFDGTIWTRLDNEYIGIENRTKQIIADNKGNAWLLYSGYMVKHDGLFFTTFDTINSGFPKNFPRSIAINPVTNDLWLVSPGIKLYKFDGYTWKTFEPDFDDLKYVDVIKIYIDNRQNVWICTRSGLYKFDNNHN